MSIFFLKLNKGSNRVGQRQTASLRKSLNSRECFWCASKAFNGGSRPAEARNTRGASKSYLNFVPSPSDYIVKLRCA